MKRETEKKRLAEKEAQRGKERQMKREAPRGRVRDEEIGTERDTER